MTRIITVEIARRQLEQVTGKPLSRFAIYRIIQRHRIPARRVGGKLRLSPRLWRKYVFARTVGNVLTRSKREYERRGPKPRPKPPRKRRGHRGQRGRQSPVWRPDSRRNLARKRRAAKKRAKTLAAKRAAEDW